MKTYFNLVTVNSWLVAAKFPGQRHSTYNGNEGLLLQERETFLEFIYNTSYFIS